jgi:uncharacterized membrane protein YdcZ (DUF606 family)
MNAIVLQSIVFAGAVMGGVIAAVSRAPIAPKVPAYVAFGVGFFVLAILLLPVENIVQRTVYGRETPVWRAVLWSLAGAMVGSAIFALMR